MKTLLTATATLLVLTSASFAKRDTLDAATLETAMSGPIEPTASGVEFDSPAAEESRERAYFRASYFRAPQARSAFDALQSCTGPRPQTVDEFLRQRKACD